MVLSYLDVLKSNRIYDDRNECYEQYINLVAVATNWQETYDIQNRQLKKLQAEKITRAKVQEMTDKEFKRLQKQVKKLLRSLRRTKTFLWVLVGYGVVSTAAVAVLVSVK